MLGEDVSLSYQVNTKRLQSNRPIKLYGVKRLMDTDVIFGKMEPKCYSPRITCHLQKDVDVND